MGVVVRRYIDFLILLIRTPLVSALFCNSILLLFIFNPRRACAARITVVCLVNCVLCIVISRMASPGAKVTTKMNSTGYLHQDRRVVFYIMP